MSYDLYFLALVPGETWDDAIGALEQAAEVEHAWGPEDDSLWGRICEAVAAELPALEEHASARSRELTHEASGISLSMYPGELSLSVPYWYEGKQAEALTATLTRVVHAIEGATGLTAYDPQSEQAVLAGGADAAPEVFQQVHDSFAERGITSGQGAMPKPRRGLFGRRKA